MLPDDGFIDDESRRIKGECEPKPEWVLRKGNGPCARRGIGRIARKEDDGGSALEEILSCLQGPGKYLHAGYRDAAARNACAQTRGCAPEESRGSRGYGRHNGGGG